MPNFLHKVEAYRKDKDLKGHIAPFKPKKARKARRFDGGVSLGEPGNSNTNFVHLRAMMSNIFSPAMFTVDPFDIKDRSWVDFFKDVAPLVITTLLWDTNRVPKPEDRKQLMRLFKQHIR
jgi:hypothetical protein